MKFIITLIIITFRFGGLLLLPIFIYGLIILPFTASMDSATDVVKVFVFSAGIIFGVLTVRFLKLKGDSLLNNKLSIPDDIKAKFKSISGSIDQKNTIEDTLFSIIDSPTWYNSKKEESIRPKELALLVLFLVQLINIERDAKKRENE